MLINKIRSFSSEVKERGFVLVGVLGTLLVMTIVGTSMMVSSKHHSKSATESVASNMALEAAKSGIVKLFVRYGDPATANETKAIAEFSGSGTVSASYGGVVPPYYTNLSIDSIADIPSDAWLAANANSFLIFDVTPSGLVQKKTWSSNPSKQQVAVWVETYDSGPDLYKFPYSTNGVSNAYHVTNGLDAKHGLSFVAYAIGSYGKEKKVVRERIAVGAGILNDLAVINNAPRFANNPDLCLDGPSESASSSGRASEHNKGRSDSHGNPMDNLFLDSTQTWETMGMKSNNGIVFGINSNGNDFDYRDAVSSIIAGNMNPWTVYDEGKVDKMLYPSVNNGQHTSLFATTTKANLYGTPEYLNYFANASANLLHLNAYREAANRLSGFDGENINGYTVTTGGNALGNADNLKANNSDHARTGTMSWKDFAYNMENSIPMYGIVRVLVPTRLENNKERKNHDNNICGSSDTNRYIPIINYDTNGDGKHDSKESGIDELKNNGNDGKIIVYGSLLFDYFFDDNEDGLFDVTDNNEFILDFKKAMTVNLNIDIPVLINPVFDGFNPISTGITSNYTAIGLYQDGSPSVDQSTDVNAAMNGYADTGTDMVRVSKNVRNEIYNGVINFTTYKNLLKGTNYKRKDILKMLEYYHLTRAYASSAAYSHISLSNIEANASTFMIDSDNDTEANKASLADLYHVFMPSGYVHGWKRAIDELGMTANEWNTLLIGDGSPYAGIENKIFFINNDGVHDVIDSQFADIPAAMMNAGVFNFEGPFNISGVIYTPGTLVFSTKGKIPPTWTADTSFIYGALQTNLFDQCSSKFAGDAGDIKDCQKKAVKELNKLVKDIKKDVKQYKKDCKKGDTVKVDFKSNGKKFKVKIDACSLITETPVSGIDSYVSGATISGYGTFFDNQNGADEGNSMIFSFDDVSTDLIPVAHDESIVRRTHWEEVR